MKCRFCKREALSDDRVCLKHLIDKANFCAVLGLPDLPCNDGLNKWIEAAPKKPTKPLTEAMFNKTLKEIFAATELL